MNNVKFDEVAFTKQLNTFEAAMQSDLNKRTDEVGAKWDFKEKCVMDSDPKVPLVEFPVIWLEPIELEGENLSPSENFECPLYKTSARKGELSTTGHSTNFVLMLNLPSKVHQDYWIRRGTALLCMTDD